VLTLLAIDRNGAEAVCMASAAPAAVIGLDERKGRIEAGFDADITILDRTYRTLMTIVGGKVVYEENGG